MSELEGIIQHAVPPIFKELIEKGRDSVNLTVEDFCELYAKALHFEVVCFRQVEKFKFPNKEPNTKKEVSEFLDFTVFCNGGVAERGLYKGFLVEPLTKIWDYFYSRKEGINFLIFAGIAAIRKFDRTEPEHWIILPASVFKKEQGVINFVILHELAHYLLGYGYNKGVSRERQEDEANTLATNWNLGNLSPSL